jgi:hypothetical protein
MASWARARARVRLVATAAEEPGVVSHRRCPSLSARASRAGEDAVQAVLDFGQVGGQAEVAVGVRCDSDDRPDTASENVSTTEIKAPISYVVDDPNPA